MDWCGDVVDSGRFADQGYLNSFPTLFDGVVVVDLPGVDVAPWNLRRHSLAVDRAGQVLVDGSPLIFFHFHGLAQEGNRFYFKHVPYLAKTTSVIREAVYLPYCKALKAASPLCAQGTSEMKRKPTLLASLKSGRAATLRWLGEMRHDFVDVP